MSTTLLTLLSFLIVLFNFSFSQPVTGPGEWTLVNRDAPWEARAGLQVVPLNGSFYLMGGRTPNPPGDPVIPGDSRIWNDVWKSDDLGVSWQELSQPDPGPRWPARAYFQAVETNGLIYVLGGQNFFSEPNPDCPPPFNNCSPFISSSDFFNDVWRSEDGLNWEMMTDSAGWSGRAGFSSVVFNGEIYVMGGSINDDASIIGGPPTRIYLNDVWKSANGSDWELLTDNAPWEKRAGGVAVVKDGYIYLVGGEEGFVCLPGSPCPPYFNDVWRSSDGINWEEVTPQAAWKKRPGHQVVVLDDHFVLFGGFGLSENIFDPFAAANPRDIWVSSDGAEWERISRRPWNALTQEEVKYDFDALSIVHPQTGQMVAFTFGGDRESFDFTDPLNYLNVDNDVWSYCLDACSVVSSSEGTVTPFGREVSVYPNPTSGKSKLMVNTSVEGSLACRVVDQWGRTIDSMEFPASRGGNSYELNLSAYPTGMYHLMLIHNGQLLSKRIIRAGE